MMKLFQGKTVVILILVSALVLAGCGENTPVADTYEADQAKLNEEAVGEVVEEETETPKVTITAIEYPYSFTDKFGNEQIIENKPDSYVSFSPDVTETLFALNVGDHLVGRSSDSNYPVEAFDILDFGSLDDFDLEALLAAEPDLVFLPSAVTQEVYQQFVDAGFTLAVFDIEANLEGTKSLIENIGNVVGKNKKAAYIISEIDTAMEKLADKSADREAKSVYFVVEAGEQTKTATGDTIMGAIIQAAGGINVAADSSNGDYTVEELVEADPEFLICSKRGNVREELMELTGYKDLTAVKEGKIYEIDQVIFSRQGPRVVDAMYVLDALLYEAN